jgi:hypothetical protein
MAKKQRFNIGVHSTALLFVAFIFTTFYLLRFGRRIEPPHPYQAVTDIINFKDSLEVTLFEETLDIFQILKEAKKDSLINSLKHLQETRLRQMNESDNRFVFSPGNLKKIFIMYLQFIIAYVIIMILSYYGVQTIALYRFIKFKQSKSSCLEHLIKNRFKPVHVSFGLLLHAIIKGIGYIILFSPGYVLAYALKTKIDTNNFIFMIILATFTNGLLILYSQKFFTFLIHEDRKGYVQTAIVKNLHYSYFDRSLYRSLLRLKKKFMNHILDHIYMNARYQYLSTINEQASFLITGLIIIEMALNIQNHFSYELLQHLLYKNYLVALIMIFAIFLIVKLTEMCTDYWRFLEKESVSNE